MVTYTAKSSVVTVTNVTTLLVSENRDRLHLEWRNSGAYFGGSDVSTSNGYSPSDTTVFEGDAATAAVYGVTASGSISIHVLEIVRE